jgi:hypothetical protein
MEMEMDVGRRGNKLRHAKLANLAPLNTLQ